MRQFLQNKRFPLSRGTLRRVSYHSASAKRHSGPMRFLEQHITSPLLHRLAGFSRSPFSLVQYVDPATGGLSERLIFVERIGSGFLLAFPEEANATWCRNVLAACTWTVRWHGEIYKLDKPKTVDPKTGLRAFSLPLRLILRASARKHFRIMMARISQS